MREKLGDAMFAKLEVAPCASPATLALLLSPFAPAPKQQKAGGSVSARHFG